MKLDVFQHSLTYFVCVSRTICGIDWLIPTIGAIPHQGFRISRNPKKINAKRTTVRQFYEDVARHCKISKKFNKNDAKAKMCPISHTKREHPNSTRQFSSKSPNVFAICRSRFSQDRRKVKTKIPLPGSDAKAKLGRQTGPCKADARATNPEKNQIRNRTPWFSSNSPTFSLSFWNASLASPQPP